MKPGSLKYFLKDGLSKERLPGFHFKERHQNITKGSLNQVLLLYKSR
jgi:hypothetical protein